MAMAGRHGLMPVDQIRRPFRTKPRLTALFLGGLDHPVNILHTPIKIVQDSDSSKRVRLRWAILVALLTILLTDPLRGKRKLSQTMSPPTKQTPRAYPA